MRKRPPEAVQPRLFTPKCSCWILSSISKPPFARTVFGLEAEVETASFSGTALAKNAYGVHIRSTRPFRTAAGCWNILIELKGRTSIDTFPSDAAVMSAASCLHCLV